MMDANQQGITNPQDLSHLSRVELESLVHHLLQQTDRLEYPLPSALSKQETERRLQEVTILHAVANTCAKENDEEQLIAQITHIVSSALPCDIFGVLLIDETDKVLRPHPAYQTNDLEQGLSNRLSEGITGLVASDGVTRNIGDVTTHPHYLQANSEIRSELCVPFRLYGRIVGVLNAESKQCNAFSPTEAHLLETISEQLGLTIERLRADARSQRHVQQLATLNQMAQALTSSLDLPEVLQRIIDSVFHLVHAEGVVVLLQESPGMLKFAAVSGQGATGLQGTLMPDSKGIAGQVIQSGRPVHIRGRVHSPAQIYEEAEQVSGFNTETLLAVPIILNGRTIGVIEAAHSEPNAFDNNAQTLLLSASHWAAIALHNAQLFQREHNAHIISETLRRANLALTKTLDLDVVLDNFLRYLKLLVPYDGACVMLVKDEASLEIKAIRGYEDWADPEELVRAKVEIVQYTLFQQLMTTQESILIADTSQEPEWVAHEALGESGYNWLGVPLVANEKVIGIYSIDKREPHSLTQKHVERGETLAAQAAVALENALLYETQRRQYAQLQQSQMQLIQAEKMGALGRLAASIGHEINNPIQAIQGCLTLVTEELNSTQNQDNINLYMEILNSELSRIATIVQRLRDFYRPARTIRQTIDLRTIVAGVLELSGKQLERSFVTVQQNYPEQLPQVHVNQDHIKQVFLNLLLNSIEAMPEGGTITITMCTDCLHEQETEQPQPAVRIEFHDTGEGIEPDVLEQLFEPFTTTKQHGSGLGLSITYGIIQEHSGQITVESTVGEGTRFVILLPAVEPSE